jgi:hypothetical protein
MTMAVGFVCHEGVVIGADRQITGSSYTFPERKVFTWAWGNGYGIYAYSGTRDINVQFGSEVGSVFDANVDIEREDVPRLWKKCIDSLSLKRNEAFLTLFGFILKDSKRPTLLISNMERRVVPTGQAEVIGYGDSPLARSLLGRLKNVGGQLLTVQQARVYAVDFISQAKKYDGQYVGDGIDVFSLDHSGDGGSLCGRVLDAGQTGDWEQNIDSAHYWCDVFFRELINSQSEMINLNLFMERMQQFRHWTGGAPIPSVSWPKRSDLPNQQ